MNLLEDMLDRALTELLELFKDWVLPFDTDAACHYADLAVTDKNGGRGFPTPRRLHRGRCSIAGLHRGIRYVRPMWLLA